MRTKSDQLDILVAQLQPVRDEDLTSEPSSQSVQSLFERIVADLEREPAPRRSRVAPRWVLPAVGLATVAVAIAIAIGIGPSAKTVTPAAAALREVADAARAQDGIPAGKYLYVQSENANLAIGALPVGSSDPEAFLECCDAFLPHVREMWLGDEPGDALLRERKAGPPQFLSDEERERWIALGRPELLAKTPFSGILVGLRPRDWYEGPLDLPSDADAIYEQFEQAAERSTPLSGVPHDLHVSAGMFHHFSDVLREARATPEQRAAAYEALARVPHVTLLGKVTDRFGRRGVAVAMNAFDNEPDGFLFRHVLVFDPETADLLEERREVLPGNQHRGLPAGLIEAYATYEYAVVDGLGERPAAQG